MLWQLGSTAGIRAPLPLSLPVGLSRKGPHWLQPEGAELLSRSFFHSVLGTTWCCAAGAKTGWRLGWLTLMRELAPQSKDGAFTRPTYAFDANIGDPAFPVESERTPALLHQCSQSPSSTIGRLQKLRWGQALAQGALCSLRPQRGVWAWACKGALQPLPTCTYIFHFFYDGGLM